MPLAVLPVQQTRKDQPQPFAAPIQGMGRQARGHFLEPPGGSRPRRPAFEAAAARPPTSSQSRSRRQAGTPQPPQLVFELASIGGWAQHGGARLAARPSVARARTLAAIQNFGQLEGIHQRSAPLRTVTFHLARPVARLCGGLGDAVEQTPVEARRFVAGAVAGA